jgi:putative resolvase
MKLSSYAQQIEISYNTAWRMWKRGQLPGYQLPTGTVIVEPPQRPEQHSTSVRTVAVYARVSRSENKKNLDTQAERLITWFNAASAGRSSRWSKSVGVG